MSGIITQPGSIKKVAAAAIFKFRSPAFEKEECKEYLKSLPDDLEEYVQWLKESMEKKRLEIESYVMTQKKQKALDNINYRMRGDNTLAMIEVLTPMVEKVKKAYKKILKSDEVPEEVETELPTVLYLCDLLNIANWNKLKKQLSIKYGNEFMDDLAENRTDVDSKILEFVNYKPKEKIVRDKYKEFEDAWKLQLKKEEEELDIEELDEDVETESDTQIRDEHNLDDIDSDNLSPRVEKQKRVKKSLKKEESSSESESESDSDSESESDKKPKKALKKAAKKEESSSDSDSDSDSDSSSEEEKKPAKKAVKKEESSSDSDSDSDSSSEEEKKPAKKAAKKEESSSDSDSDSDSDSSSEEEKKPAKKAAKKEESSSDSSSN